MAGFFRGKQAGIAKDLSADLTPDLFLPDDQARYGINSQPSCLTYDPVQSLLALGTSESRFGPGRIYVFGAGRVHRILDPPRPTSITSLFFSAGRLVSIDVHSELTVWDLGTGTRSASTVVPGGVACATVDPLLDWVLLGLGAGGEIAAYDLDRERMSAVFRLPNLWLTRDPTAQKVGIVALALHPRDVGQLLVGYTHGAVVFSIKQNLPVKFLEYMLPPGAPGGDDQPSAIPRRPVLTHAVWHPTGAFIATAHEDGSIVFWDPKGERVVLARTVAELRIDKPPATPRSPPPGRLRRTEPVVRLAWCCKQNPDDTALLIAGGGRQLLPGSEEEQQQEGGVTFIELGPTPVYATSSWQALEEHFRGRRTLTLPVPQGAEIRDLVLIPRASPHFAGAQDPIAVMVQLTSGELLTLTFPSGYAISPTNQLHPSLSFVHPYVTRFAVAPVGRERWLGMTETRDRGEPLLRGGVPASKPRRRYEDRTILQVAHGDGTIRLWDPGHGDEIENEAQLQVDLARGLDRYEDVDVTAMSLSGATGEFAAGTGRGEVVVYRWDRNRQRQQQNHDQSPTSPNPGLTEIGYRAEPGLKEGLQPLVLYDMGQGPITALRVSGVGFLAAGSENGTVAIVDLRGPAVILHESVAGLGKEKRSSFLKGGHASSSSQSSKEHPVVIEFGVMTLDDDKYSSIACFVGTSTGRVLTYKILPSGGGAGYTAAFAGAVSYGDRVVAICPIVADTGQPAAATGDAAAGLRAGKQVHGVLVVATQREIRIFKPSSHKGASKDFDDMICESAAICEVELRGRAMVCIFRDKTSRAFSLPALKEIGRAALPMVDDGRIGSAVVTATGNVFAWTGPSELAVLECWGAGRPLQPGGDLLIDAAAVVPPRPTISNLQWLAGTQYVSPADLDLLIGGPDRPPSKRMMEAEAAERHAAKAAAAQEAAGGQGGGGQGGGGSGSAGEGWSDYLSRQLSERTERLNLMGDQMDNLASSSQGWADDVGKYINKQKRNVVLGAIKGKFL